MPLITLHGPIIEIDELWCGGKKRDSRGRNVAPSTLVFGIYCRQTKKIILYAIENRKSETLIPILLMHTTENQIIMSATQ